MKTIPPTCPEPETGPQYWRSLEQLEDTPEFRDWVQREFPAGASEFTDPVSRRHFVKIMSASFLLAGLGLTGCRRPEEKLVPFSRLPENYVHGLAQSYATAMPTRSSALPLVVRSNDGRPTKIEGNALHPDSGGGTDRFAQASILNLYDPDRSRRVLRSGKVVSREVGLDFLRQTMLPFGGVYGELGVAEMAGDSEASSREWERKKGGRGLAVLLERSSSASRARLERLLRERFPEAGWYVHEPVDFEIHRQASARAFGKPVFPYYQLDRARVMVSLDADFIGTEPDAQLHIRQFARGRRLRQPSDSMNRLYAVEALFSLTGANADHRLRVPAGQVPRVAAELARAVLAAAGLPGSEVGELLAAAAERGQGLPPTLVDPEWIAQCAADLVANQGAALVMAGHRQPIEVHLLAHAMNVALEAVGQTLLLRESASATYGTLPELVQALQAGTVDTLVILGANPVYSAPADLEWAAAQRRANTVIRLATHEDETSEGCDLHLPMAHYLESWGDARTSDGTLVPIQPLIAPLFGGLTELEILARMGSLEKTNPYEIVRETFARLAGSDEERWKRFLHDGFLVDSAAAPVPVQFEWNHAARLIQAASQAPIPSVEALEVVFHRDVKVDDGRHVNNGWLQEMPDPITQMTWENVVLMSQATADALGLRIVDRNNHNLQVPLVTIEVGSRSVTGPAWIQPGMADFVIGLALGYGRPKAGRVGSGSGYNAYELRTAAAPHRLDGAKLTAAGRNHELAVTQNHWSMEGRPIIREANLDEYRAKPRFAKAMDMHEPPDNRPLYPNPMDVPGRDGLTPRERAPHQWGMSVDLTACVGCATCVMACQSENNIPIVGKEQVSRQREMHWLRVDRYYTGAVADPQMVTQPMFCLHCESAPCESVCPVNATVHDEEGLNLMVYNRCVGTRYCSNNCPFKVRRFNFFDYHRRPLNRLYKSPLTSATDGQWELLRWFKNPERGSRPGDEWELLKLATNPDVTVRMRGVMEKCTYCIQRIEQAKITRKIQAGPSGDIVVPDGTFQTACQQACPAEAIVFGNLKDPGKCRVSRQGHRPHLRSHGLPCRPAAHHLPGPRAQSEPADARCADRPFSTEEYLEQNPHGHGDHGDHGAHHAALSTGVGVEMKGGH
jgi:MoCo/4Fe-4S cofactor protein with predicted Tat translocation signal